jgi:FAD/FMN-containing dehydrogenase
MSHLQERIGMATESQGKTSQLGPSLWALAGLLGAGLTAAWLRAVQRRTKRQRVAAEHEPREIYLARHARKVQRVTEQLQQRDSQRPVRIRKQAVSHMIPKPRDLKHQDDQIDISDFQEILEIDPVSRTCVAESGVTFVDLVAATLRYGLVPIIVPELKTITVGGAVSGCSLESMSFVYGGFHDTCLSYELVTAKGEVLHCTPENEHGLLFQMIHSSFGTLGILTLLRFQLIPAKPFVKLEYEKYSTVEQYQAAIWQHYKLRDVDFVDGIIHSDREYVLCVGRFVEHAPYTNRYDWTQVYYLSTQTRTEDYLETSHYFFRYDHGVTNVHPKSFLGRLFFAPLFGSDELMSVAYQIRKLLPHEKPTIILDVFIPFSKLPEFLQWFQKEFQFFPLWCVPYKKVRNYEWLSKRFFEINTDELMIDLAIYGMEQKGDRNYHKIMEDKLLEIGGLKTLISHNYFSEEDFWKIWNRENYAKVKAITDPDNIFRDFYRKTCRVPMGSAD